MATGETIREIIFVGLPGPTHHYGGMAAGNLAAETNAGDLSRPREAAQQALVLMETLRELGLEVGILPPQLRPCLPILQELGYEGEAEQVIPRVLEQEPELLGRVSSSAAMWTANAATVTASVDSETANLHLTPANLLTHFHRSIEAQATHHVLAQIFAEACHPPLPAQDDYADEGAANHLRLAPTHSDKGLNIFIYGRARGSVLPNKFPARQTLASVQAIARRHGIPESQSLFVQQNPAAIDAGVFHNDVISVANESLLLTHEHAYAGGEADIQRIRDAYAALHPGKDITVITIRADELSVEEAVATYFFNSQIVTLPEGGMAIIAPQEVKNHTRAYALMERIVAENTNPLTRAIYLDLRQSMKNGGGPACLRLRVPVSVSQIPALAARTRTLVDDALLGELYGWVKTHYRETLSARDLTNPALYHECRTALSALEALLRLSLLDAY